MYWIHIKWTCKLLYFVGKFSTLEGSNHTWKWVWRYGVYTHQVPDYPDSIVVSRDDIQQYFVKVLLCLSKYCCACQSTALLVKVLLCNWFDLFKWQLYQYLWPRLIGHVTTIFGYNGGNYVKINGPINSHNSIWLAMSIFL